MHLFQRFTILDRPSGKLFFIGLSAIYVQCLSHFGPLQIDDFLRHLWAAKQLVIWRSINEVKTTRRMFQYLEPQFLKRLNSVNCSVGVHCHVETKHLSTIDVCFTFDRFQPLLHLHTHKKKLIVVLLCRLRVKRPCLLYDSTMGTYWSRLNIFHTKAVAPRSHMLVQTSVWST